jgi:hypothetical protein
VKTSTGEYKRPIVKICLLPIETNELENPDGEQSRNIDNI